MTTIRLSIFYSCRVWRDIFGSSDFTLRAFSVLASVLGIVLLYDVARSLHGTPMALWAASIMAVAGPQIQFAQEGRGYAMLAALCMGACAALARIERHGTSWRRQIALGGCVAAMMLTHYFALAPAAAIGAYVLLRLRGRAPRCDPLAAARGDCLCGALGMGPLGAARKHRTEQLVGD